MRVKELKQKWKQFISTLLIVLLTLQPCAGVMPSMVAFGAEDKFPATPSSATFDKPTEKSFKAGEEIEIEGTISLQSPWDEATQSNAESKYSLKGTAIKDGAIISIATPSNSSAKFTATATAVDTGITDGTIQLFYDNNNEALCSISGISVTEDNENPDPINPKVLLEFTSPGNTVQSGGSIEATLKATVTDGIENFTSTTVIKDVQIVASEPDVVDITKTDNDDGTATVTIIGKSVESKTQITLTASYKNDTYKIDENATFNVTVEPSESKTPTVTLSFDVSQLPVAINGTATATLTAKVSGGDGTLTPEAVISAVECTSGDEAVATVNSNVGNNGTATVTVTGKSEGNATITATYEDIKATFKAIVSTDGNVTSNVVLSFESESPITLEKGDTKEVTLKATDSNAVLQENEIFENVEYTSSDDSVATVDSHNAGTVTITANKVGSATITARYGSAENAPKATLTVNVTEKEPESVVTLSFSPAKLSIEKDKEGTSTLTAKVGDVVSQDVIKSVTYTSSNESIATVNGDETGKVTVKALAKGTATITATYISGDTKVEATLTVEVTENSSVSDKPNVTLKFDVSELSVAIDGTKTATLTATVSGGDGTLTSDDVIEAVTYTSSNDTVATVSGNGGATVTVTGKSEGNVTITATYEDIKATFKAIVSTDGNVTSNVVLSFESESPITLEKGDTKEVTLKATDSNAVLQENEIFENVEYTSSDDSVATVNGDNAGTVIITANKAGSATITASYGSNEDAPKATLTVTVTEKAPEPVVTLSFAPDTLSIEEGKEGTSTLTAKVDDVESQDVIKSVTYTSSNNEVATVSGDEAGTVTVKALAKGTATITATYTSDDTTVTATLTVKVTEKEPEPVAPVVELSFSPDALSIEKGKEGTSTLTATVDGVESQDVIKSVKYTSSNNEVATVSGDEAGTVTVKALAKGTATITATYTSDDTTVTATLTVKVTEKEPEPVAPVVELSFSPDALSIEEGKEGTSTLTATVDGIESQDVIESVKYTSSNNEVATVSGDEAGTVTVTALAKGTATITATYTSDDTTVTATLTVEVTEKASEPVVPVAPVVALAFEPISLSIEKDAQGTSTLTATVDGVESQDVIDGVKYTSTDESIATVTGDGTATATVKAVAKGTTTIIATYPTEDGSITATLTVSVYEPEDQPQIEGGAADVEIAMDKPELPEMPKDESLTDEQKAQIQEELDKAPAMADAAVESIAKNTYVQTAPTRGFDRISKNDLVEAGVPIGQDVEIYPKQTLEKLVIALEKQADGTYKSVVKKVIYDITPNWKLKGDKNDKGTPFTKKVKGSFTFSIPVPSNVTARYANVTHESRTRQYTIVTNGADKYITITVNSFSPFELEFTDTRVTTSTTTSGGGGGGGGGSRITGSSNSYAMTGSWIADATGWKFVKSDGQQAANTWGWINNQWYYFDATGIMATGWRFINNKWYYMNPVQGSTEGVMVIGWNFDPAYNAWFFLDASGAMVTGWNQIGDKWYYFNPISDGTQGAMAMNTYVDGYYVGADGAWIPTN